MQFHLNRIGFSMVKYDLSILELNKKCLESRVTNQNNKCIAGHGRNNYVYKIMFTNTNDSFVASVES